LIEWAASPGRIDPIKVEQKRGPPLPNDHLQVGQPELPLELVKVGELEEAAAGGQKPAEELAALFKVA
jgi:hypothetical protein